MSLLTAELRKVWGNRVFPMLLAVLAERARPDALHDADHSW